MEIDYAGRVDRIPLLVEAGLDLVILGGLEGEVMAKGCGPEGRRAWITRRLPRS